MAFASINNLVTVTKKLVPSENPTYTQLTADQIKEIYDLEMEIEDAKYPFNFVDVSYYKDTQTTWTGNDNYVSSGKKAT